MIKLDEKKNTEPTSPVKLKDTLTNITAGGNNKNTPFKTRKTHIHLKNCHQLRYLRISLKDTQKFVQNREIKHFEVFQTLAVT